MRYAVQDVKTRLKGVIPSWPIAPPAPRHQPANLSKYELRVPAAASAAATVARHLGLQSSTRRDMIANEAFRS